MEGKMQHANDNRNGLRFLSVCSGIEAASVAWHPLGWRAVAFSEIEKFPSAVLKHHYPDVPNLGDFTKIDTKTLGRVDILAGGTPCQAFSVAGLRQSLADARGNLSLEFVRLAHELAANNGLRNVVWENVVGVLSTKDNAFGCFLAGLVGADSPIEPPRRGKWARHGMVSGPKGRAAWAVKDGQFFGVAQRRRRVLVVADFGNGADPAAVLFEPESMFRDTPPSREAGKGITHPVAPSLVSSGRGIERPGDPRGQDPVVAVTVAIRGRDGGSTAELGGDIATALRASQGGGDKPHVLAFDCKASGQSGFGVGEIAGTQRAMGHKDSHTNGGGHQAAMVGSAVRRLTPVECERLQGFPDGYTDIPWRGKPTSPDGPRYKALGNSWAVPKFVWLGQRIARFMPANDNQETPIANAA
ncbi:DNA cytosine methyltransferase [Agrobacterium sp. RC10-4-1]|uniref:DNA cytosine methyltransferase n=1 Tax=Agrobacterium sp. RC10-4-1 TaxID=2587039 RepID=UPI00256EA0EE|nr:DNA cytosine methyltransferase [Agrobacterium sp. RC10-4-1]